MTSKQQMIDAVNSLLVLAQALPDQDPQIEQLLAQIADLQAQVAALQSQLSQAQVALQAEISLEEADQVQIAALQAKISSALAALQG